MENEKITYIKYCPNVFLAKCEAQHEKGEIINVETRRGDLHECEVHNFIGRTKDGGYAYSITRTDGTNKATVAARRAERRREWAQKAEGEKAESHLDKADYWDRKAEDITLDMPESLEHFKELLEAAKEYHEGVKSGKYPREHAYTLTYAKKRVNELKDKVATAEKLWGEQQQAPTA